MPLLPLSGESKAAWADKEASVFKFIDTHCHKCHDETDMAGDLDFLAFPFDLADRTQRERWIKVHDRVDHGEMPPPEKVEALSIEERQILTDALGNALFQADRSEIVKEGRGQLRRITREEYEYNLRDLLKLPDLDIRDKLPQDRDAHGITKVSKLLDMSHVQLEAYLDAAEAALEQAVATGVNPPESIHYRAIGLNLFPALESFGNREAMFFAREGKWVSITKDDFQNMTPEERCDDTLELALFRSATWPYFGYPRDFVAPLDGNYRVRFSGRAVRQVRDFRIVPAYEPLPMSFRARKPSDADVSGDVRETGGWIDLEAELKVFETTIQLKKGETFEYSLLGLPVPFIRTDSGFYYDYPPMPPEGHRGAAFQWLEVEGPVTAGTWPPESHKILFEDLPIRSAPEGSRYGVDVVTENPVKDTERLFRNFVKKITGIPVSEYTVQNYLSLVNNKLEENNSFVEAMLKGYQAFLCSGHFLYLEEPAGKDRQFEIATRLSHFLWSSRPDESLLRLAQRDRLKNPRTLKDQAGRYIDDARFDRFVNSFVDQWLELRQLRRDIPDNRLYPEYRKDDYLVDSMERETRAYWRAMVRENLPVTTIVDSDFTFVNDRLARHYDLQPVQGSQIRRVSLPDWSPYGGLLTQASILKLTANGTTTSPVLRGVWVMEKLLGDPPPPPPKTVPGIEPDIRGASTIRELLAKHTESESCLNCHARFDPVGFALENFDVMGAWRDRYRGMEEGDEVTGYDPAGHPYNYFVGRPVDSSGQLRDGRTFKDIRELKALLVSEPRLLARNLLHQFTLYATGTPVRFSDRSEIEAILDSTERKGFKVRDLLLEFILSDVFCGFDDSLPITFTESKRK